MFGTSLQLSREDRFFHSTKSLLRFHSNNHISSRIQENSFPVSNNCSVQFQSNRTAFSPSNNLERFLDSTTPSVSAYYLAKTKMRGWRICDVEYMPYFVMGDLWESFKEWSVYGVGVGLVVDGSACVDQYYVPYLSGMQLYGDSGIQLCGDLRQPDDESEGDYCTDSSSDGCSDYEYENSLKLEKKTRNHSNASMIRMDHLRENCVHMKDGFSSDDSDAGNAQACLLFEYLEHEPPYCREPLADKISELACCFPELNSLRSCDLLPASWISIAWYPIYQIPTGPSLKDLDACFLTFHSLSTPLRGSRCARDPQITYFTGSDTPKISLPAFGLASYKFRTKFWIADEMHERQSLSSLVHAADSWLRLLDVHHPDYQFFSSHSAIYG